VIIDKNVPAVDAAGHRMVDRAIVMYSRKSSHLYIRLTR
jgi:hypothetical protein